MHRLSMWLLVSATSALLLVSCGSGGGTTPDPNRPQLAGGGRGSNNDNFTGGPASSGPQTPGAETGAEPAPGYIPLYYSERNCFPGAFEQLITNQTDWEAWWATAIACQDRWMTSHDEIPPSTGGGGSDPGYGEPEPWDPYGDIAPTIDWSTYVVAAIGLAPEATFGRGLWVMSVESTASGSTITYEISRPGDDCFFGAPNNADAAPTLATLLPRPVTEPVSFVSTETVWNCTFTPDPAEPWTIYYTDAACGLGPNESLITDEATWLAWLASAYECDVQRWNDRDYPTFGGGSTEPGSSGASPPYYPGDDEDDYKNPVDEPGIDPYPPPPGTWGLELDFSTHAVLILRTTGQTRWGGGIWLNSLNPTAAGTEIEYSIMQPAGNCPSAGGATLRPTVAIRIPKPSGAITYVRHTELIDCNWDGGDGVVSPPEPRPEPGF